MKRRMLSLLLVFSIFVMFIPQIVKAADRDIYFDETFSVRENLQSPGQSADNKLKYFYCDMQGSWLRTTGNKLDYKDYYLKLSNLNETGQYKVFRWTEDVDFSKPLVWQFDFRATDSTSHVEFNFGDYSIMNYNPSYLKGRIDRTEGAAGVLEPGVWYRIEFELNPYTNVSKVYVNHVCVKEETGWSYNSRFNITGTGAPIDIDNMIAYEGSVLRETFAPAETKSNWFENSFEGVSGSLFQIGYQDSAYHGWRLSTSTGSAAAEVLDSGDASHGNVLKITKFGTAVQNQTIEIRRSYYDNSNPAPALYSDECKAFFYEFDVKVDNLGQNWIFGFDDIDFIHARIENGGNFDNGYENAGLKENQWQHIRMIIDKEHNRYRVELDGRPAIPWQTLTYPFQKPDWPMSQSVESFVIRSNWNHNQQDSTLLLDNLTAGPIIEKQDLPKDTKAATVTVGKAPYYSKANVDYVCDGTIDDDKVIQKAIDDIMEPGGKVVLMEGEYHLKNNILIKNSHITLEGMGSGTVLYADTNMSAPFGLITILDAEDCTTLRNFRLMLGTAPSESKLHGVVIDNSHLVTVENLEISGFFGSGIYMLDNSQNCKITNNIIFSCSNSGIFVSGYSGTATAPGYGGNVISGNICKDNEVGITLRGETNSVIGTNNLSGSYYGSLKLIDSAYNTIVGNNCSSYDSDPEYSSTTYNIMLDGSSNYNLVVGNTVPGKDVINNGIGNQIGFNMTHA